MRTLALLSMMFLAASASRAAQAPPPQPDYPKINLVPGYAVDPEWPRQRPEKPWGEMSGVSIDRDGNIWTLNRSETPVQVFSPDGKLLQTWSNEHVKKGHQIRFDPRDGNVWITDLILHVARKFDRTGKPLLTIGTPGEAGADDKHLFLPTDIAIAPSGEVFISDGYGNNRIVHCDATGKFINSWGSMGVKDGEFSLPHSIVIDSKAQLYVADRNNGRVQVFDQTGKFLRAFSGKMVPWTLHITDNDDIYVIGSSPDRWPRTGRMLGVPPRDQIVMRINPQLEIQSWWAFDFQPDAKTATTRPGALCWVHALAVDAQGNLYLGDIQGKRIQKFLLQGSGKLADQH
jgi:sugar lactone lactonase YvrE